MAQEVIPDSKDVVFGHRVCQSKDAKWLCLDNIYHKFYRPNFYDIGGTYILDVADYWFLYKTDAVGNLFLLHLFISNRHEGCINVGVSVSSEMKLNKKHDAVHLSSSLKNYHFRKPKEMATLYLTTYSFTDLDIEFLKNRKMYIAVSFHTTENDGVCESVLNSVKASHDFRELLTNPICSDFTIESSEGKKFKVHKAILVAHSDVFKAMLREETAESLNGTVKLVEVSTEDLSRLLEFIYTGSITDSDSCNFFNMLILADQYNLTGLRELSQYALGQQISLDNALEILVAGDMYNADVLKTSALKFIKNNVCVLNTNTFMEIKNVDLVRELCKYLVLDAL